MADSDDENSRPTASNLKKLRSVAAESQRQRELTEREKVRELQRAEAAGRRKERAGRRRGDGGYTQSTLPTITHANSFTAESDDTPRPDATPLASNSQPPSPPASAPPQAPSSPHKRGGQKKTQKRSGRNQYTKDRDFSTKALASPHRPKSQPHAHVSSGDEPQLNVAEEAVTGSTSNSKNSPSSTHEVAAPSKTKLAKSKAKLNRQQTAGDGDAAKEREKDGMSLSDMKKRAAYMVEYISKAQVDIVLERQLDSASVHAPSTAAMDSFKDMSSREMMNVLSKQIVSWQKEYGEAAFVS